MIKALSEIPTTKLAALPTPIEEMPKLAAKLGLSKLYIKRDDLTGLAGGGNKARKLEYDFGEIVNGHYDVVITAGGIQSNHARMTAAAARKLGIEIKLVLGGADFNLLQGNLLLDALLGAEVRYLLNDDSNEALEKAMETWAIELTAQGRRPYIIPIGGSTGLGALGYVKAMEEIAGQLADKEIQIILAVGSCGTFAGALLGAKYYLPNARIIGISVSRTSLAIAKRTVEIMKESAALLKLSIEAGDIAVECYDEYFTEYGMLTEAGENAIIACARTEGILLDPIYTGKAMAGLFGLVERGKIDKGVPVLFLHTGGMPIIFSFEKEFSKYADITKT